MEPHATAAPAAALVFLSAARNSERRRFHGRGQGIHHGGQGRLQFAALIAPSREQLDDILRTRSGKLEETPFAVLLLALAANEKSAVLELRRNQLEKKIVFDAGSPVECRS